MSNEDSHPIPTSLDVHEHLDWSNFSPFLLSRNDNATQLAESYNRCFIDAGGGRELVLITGSAGVGKTSLAYSIQEQVEDNHGFMIGGKFEQLDNNLQVATTKCYGAFTEALTQFVERVVDDGVNTLQAVKETLESCLDSTELQVLHEMIPNLHQVIERSHLPADLSVERDTNLKGADADDRLVEILNRFVSAICSVGKPIILFLDDLQWANQSSINLLLNILIHGKEDVNLPPMLVLCTCRMDENGESHPLTSMLRDVSGQTIGLTELRITSMTENEINQVFSDLLHVPHSVSHPLAHILFHQTRGNQLFLIELIKSLLEDKLLLQENGQWIWSTEKILASGRLGCTIGRLIEMKVQRLDAQEQELLRIASCLGSSFSVAVLSHAGVVLPQETTEIIETLEIRGLISYCRKSGVCRFVHDKVQQTVYQLTPQTVIEQLHLNIGRQLRKSMPKELFAENIILISHQISLGVQLIGDPIEKEDIAELFLKAGQQAALSSSFLTAAAFSNLAISLLSRRHWREQYKLSLRIYNFAAEAEYYNGNLKRFDELVKAVLVHAKCYDDTLVARFTRIYSLASRGSMKEGLDESLDVLTNLGEKLPQKSSTLHIIFGLLRCKMLLFGKTDEFILSLPPMKDARKLAAMRLLIYSMLLAIYSSGKHVPLIAFRLTKLTMSHGLSEMACVGFGILGMVYAYQGDIEAADRYSRLSLRLLEAYGAKEWQARVCVVVYGMVSPLKHPVRGTLEPLHAAHRSSLVLGDIHFSMLCNTIYVNRCYFAGYPLSRVVKETKRCKALCSKFGQLSTQSWVELYLQQLLNLMGQSNDPLVLTGEVINEEEVMRVAKDSNPLDYLYLHFSKLQLAVYMNDIPSARSIIHQVRKLDKKKFLPYMIGLLHFYEGLANAMSSTPKDRAYARKCLAKLTVFAKHAPCNYQNKVYLIEAELAAHQAGKFDSALRSFKLSIDLAQREGFIQDQALACERAAHALERAQRRQEANQFMARAQDLYAEWGAQAMVDRLTARIASPISPS